MSVNSYERYKWMEKQLETDSEYQHLMKRLWEAEPDFRAVLDALDEEQKTAIIEYIGVYGELAERSTEIACCAP